MDKQGSHEEKKSNTEYKRKKRKDIHVSKRKGRVDHRTGKRGKTK